MTPPRASEREEPADSPPRERGEIDLIEEARVAVAAAHGERDLDVRRFGHPHDRGEPLVVACREPLRPRARRRIDVHAMAERGEARDGAIDRGGIGRESRGRIDSELPFAIEHALQAR